MINTAKKAIIQRCKAILIARDCINKARYQFQRELCDPPRIVNCFTFIHWVFDALRIEIPATLEQQISCGIPVVKSQFQFGDIIFTHGSHANFMRDIGHVGIIATPDTVIHACFIAGTVVERPIAPFLAKDQFRQIRRIII